MAEQKLRKDKFMIIIQNPFVFPVLLIMWSIDAWLWLASIQLIVKKLSPNNQLAISLCRFTAPVAKASSKLIAKCFRIDIPEWLLWPITFFILITLRYTLVSLIVSR